MWCSFLETKALVDHIKQLNEHSTVRLLNVKDIEEQFTKISINEITLDRMQKETPIYSLLHAAKLLSTAMFTTNTDIDHFLIKVNKNEALQIHWYLNKCKMSYDLEETVRKHALHIFKETLNLLDPLSVVKTSVTQLLDDLNEIPEINDQYHLINLCFLPSFDLPQKILSPELKNRILTLGTYQAQMTHIRQFVSALEKDFYFDIYPELKDFF